MIRDYKSNRSETRRGGGSSRVLVATAVLAATLASVKFLDLNAAPNAVTARAQTPPAAPISQPLTLPQVAADQPAPRTSATVKHAALPLPATKAPLAAAVQSLVDGRASEPALAPQTEPTLVLLSSGEALASSTTVTAAPTESVDSAPDTADIVSSPLDERWVEHKIAGGDSLARIFSEHQLEASLLHRIVNSDKQAAQLAQIRPGQLLRFRFDDQDELTGLELRRSRTESLHVSLSDDDIVVETIRRDVEKHVTSASGLIESSLFVDGQKAGLSDAKIMELAAIFGWDIDFALELRPGDQFRVVYEEHFLDGEKLRDGPILAAEFSNRGHTFRAVRYENAEGETGYFDDEGHSKRRAFLRTPIRFARISSRFNPKRWHPVLKRWRSHKGVDYAAPTGTPIRASGDGRVVFRGKKGGYGKTVMLEHAGSKYTTLYAHLSKYSKRSRVGNRVKQGQVIGYVGRTGLASGPHLHYEFRVNGVHKDPLRVKLPKSLALPKKEIPRFKAQTHPLLAQLDAVPTETLVARADEQ